MMRRLTFLLPALLLAATAGAQDAKGPTLERIAESGVFRIGYVPDAAPMSLRDDEGRVSGYSIELCRHIANAVKTRLALDELEIEYVPLVLPRERIDAVVTGAVDIECGATTVTLTRREKVDFTLMTFITGGTVLSTKNRPVHSLDGLAGKTLAVIDGTTTEAALRHLGELNEYEIRLRLIDTHDQGMRLVTDGRVDGYASDRVMLLGLVTRSGNAANYVLAPNVFSFEPYSLMLKRGDTDFRLLADRALAALYRTARIRRLYQDWFGRYGEPLSPIVEAMYEFQAVSD